MNSAQKWFRELSLNEQRMYQLLHPFFRNFGAYYIRGHETAIDELCEWVRNAEITEEMKNKAMMRVLWEQGYSVSKIMEMLNVSVDLGEIGIAELNHCILTGDFRLK